MIEYKIPKLSSEGIPFWFRIAQAWTVFFFRKKGQFFLYGKLLNAGLLNRVCKFNHYKEGIYLPLDNPGTLHVMDFSAVFDLGELNFVCAINHNLENFTLIDCGASFGLISMKLGSICPKIESIIAIEPNYSCCEILKKNLSLKKIDFKAINAAVSDFSGNASLIFPDGEHSSDSAYITQNDNGPIKVVQIDDIVDGNITNIELTDIAFKLDVEGQEIPAILGAKNTIAKARSICFYVEIHPKVLKRNNQNGEDILKAISNIRDTKWYISENPLHVIDENRPFFSQVEEIRQYDVIGISVASR